MGFIFNDERQVDCNHVTEADDRKKQAKDVLSVHKVSSSRGRWRRKEQLPGRLRYTWRMASVTLDVSDNGKEKYSSST